MHEVERERKKRQFPFKQHFEQICLYSTNLLISNASVKSCSLSHSAKLVDKQKVAISKLSGEKTR